MTKKPLSTGWQHKAKKTLAEYHRKRDFQATPEPAGEPTGGGAGRVFVVQLHDATALHYDFRLEVDGALISWAIPKGPSLDPTQKRLAVRTEDHPLEYAAFEGVIPEGQYGAGPVLVWDGGVYDNLMQDRNGEPIAMDEAIEKGHVKVFLHGKKLTGAFALTRTGSPGQREQWLLVKMRDAHADQGDPVTERPESILTGRTLTEIVEQESQRAGNK